MSTFVGSPTVTQRLPNDSLSFRAMAKALSYKLRVGLPGIITAFDPATQLVSVQLTLTEQVLNNGVSVPTTIPALNDVLLLLPGDSNWCITFPQLVGCECYVHFADMCISAWWASGNLSNQEVTRRHDLSDGFAVLAPRSKPKAIPNYSTTQMQIRSMDGVSSISIDETQIVLKALSIVLDGPLGSNEIPVASTTPSDHSIPVVISGTTYYIRLSTAP